MKTWIQLEPKYKPPQRPCVFSKVSFVTFETANLEAIGNNHTVSDLVFSVSSYILVLRLELSLRRKKPWMTWPNGRLKKTTGLFRTPWRGSTISMFTGSKHKGQSWNWTMNNLRRKKVISGDLLSGNSLTVSTISVRISRWSWKASRAWRAPRATTRPANTESTN